MKALFRELLKRNESVFTADDIYRMFPDLNMNAVQARIKRAIKGEEIIRLYKGVYAVNSDYSKKPILEEQVAQAIDENAFLTGLGALRYHNLIPEIVNFKTFFGTKDARVDTDLVHFEIKKLPVDLTSFGVEFMLVTDKSMRVADPVRAMMDVLLRQKIVPLTRNQICAFFRIEEEDALNINWNLASTYANRFHNPMAKKIAAAMNNDKAS